MIKKQKPRGRPFQRGNPYRLKAGQVINPAGRREMWISELLLRVLRWPAPADPCQAWADLVATGAPAGVMIAFRLCLLAMAGDLQAVRLICDLTDGPPTRRTRRAWYALAGAAPPIPAGATWL